MFLATVAKIGTPDWGISSFLGDTDYYNPIIPGTQALLVFRARWSRGFSWVAATKLGASDMGKLNSPTQTYRVA